MSENMEGVKGRVAKVDLSTEKVSIETTTEESMKKFLGGRGLAAKMMLENVEAGIDTLSPENMLVFATGPIAGTGVQGSDRLCIAAKSPLTGLFFHSSMGGRFASTLKQAGYDALVIMGKADKPKYVLVDKEHIEICNGERLMGKAPKEVLATLSREMRHFEVCTTGVAADNSVRYANIVHPRLNGRDGVAGRGGLGAVMASKNLKAIVVNRGENRGVSVFSNALLKEVKKTIQGSLNVATKHLTTLGTPFGIRVLNDMGALGTKNLTEEIFKHAENISGEKLKDQYYRKNIGCHSCPVLCGKICELGNGLYKNPEYETLFALGSMVGVDDLDKIIKANNLCDEFGLDTISMGVSIAFAIECFESGILSQEQADGHKLSFGNGDLVLTLIEETAYRRGLGRLLAEGTKRMSQILGGEAWKYAYQVKGLELPGHSARALKGMSIGYATGARGGSHQDARPRYGPGMSDYKDKVAQAITSQNLSAVGDSLIQCRFVMEAGCGIEFSNIYTDLIKATVGWRPDTVELNEIGERICNTERIFNVREGVSRKDDVLPYRVMYEEIPQGPLKGQRTPSDKLEEMLDNYYQRRGWDENGIPSR
ncbi:MAG: aldehyde ferredoxin oxidoreductase family protein [Deltaproteobacteria bacterium]|nr:aldehyde ferredoxin oxidoreductase family protein [Deltaproteobacteria bacterium]